MTPEILPRLVWSEGEGSLRPAENPVSGPLVVPPTIDAVTSATILLLDAEDINRRWMKGILKVGPHRILESRSPEEAWKILESRPVDLIISDMMLPDRGSMDFFRRLKADRRYRFTPLLVLTNVQGIENEVAVLESGADEFLIKPIQPVVIRARVQTMLRNKRMMDSLDEAEGILFSLAQTIEARDKETGDHCQRLASLSVALGTTLGLPQDDLVALHRGGYLHDIGKVAVPDAILFKKSLLSEEEWLVMRSHTTHGETICRPMKTLAPVLPIIRNHHERWNGSGYPDGLAGEEIPLLARILQLADIFDALTSSRSYKEAVSISEALEVLTEEARNGWRDPELVSVFCQMLRQPGVLENSRRLFAAHPSLPATPDDPAELRSMRDSLARMSRELHR
jgi:putative two-component system response regulator